MRALRICAEPSCGEPCVGPRCRAHRKGWTPTMSPAARGYGATHRAMRETVEAEEPGCRNCGDEGRWILDHIIPLAEGGTHDRSNYQRLCLECSERKTRHEAGRGRSRHAKTRAKAVA